MSRRRFASARTNQLGILFSFLFFLIFCFGQCFLFFLLYFVCFNLIRVSKLDESRERFAIFFKERGERILLVGTNWGFIFSSFLRYLFIYLFSSLVYFIRFFKSNDLKPTFAILVWITRRGQCSHEAIRNFFFFLPILFIYLLINLVSQLVIKFNL